MCDRDESRLTQIAQRLEQPPVFGAEVRLDDRYGALGGKQRLRISPAPLAGGGEAVQHVHQLGMLPCNSVVRSATPLRNGNGRGEITE